MSSLDNVTIHGWLLKSPDADKVGGGMLIKSAHSAQPLKHLSHPRELLADVPGQSYSSIATY